MESKTVTLKQYVDEGLVGPEHFEIKTSTVDPAALKDGEILLKVLVMSADPYLRSRIKSKDAFSGSAALKLGDPMAGFVAGKVLASKNANFVEGDLIGTLLPFSTVQIVSGETLKAVPVQVLTEYITEDQISLGVGVLGMPGATAYGGLIDILKPKEGETVFISGAAGAVGSMVGQLAKNVYNCKVIGSCGGPEKCALVTKEFGFDSAIDYKTVADADALKTKLKEAAPGGIDMYFDNVGGMHFVASFNSLRPHGRIAVCGGISQYNSSQAETLPINPLQMIYTFQRIEGFVCFPWLSGERGGAFLKPMAAWVKEGKIRAQETFFEGIDSWPLAFQSLFTGGNTGKVVVRV